MEATAIHFHVNPFTREVQYDDRLDILRDYYQDPTTVKIFHNAAFDKGMIESTGIKLRGEILDTLPLIRLAMPGAVIGLKPFCKQYLNINDDDEADLKEAVRLKRREGEKLGWKIFHSEKKGKKKDDSELAPDYWMEPKLGTKYCIRDSIRAMSVCTSLYPAIKELGMEKQWINELETFHVLRAIEERGICIDRAKVKSTISELKKKLSTYEQKAFRKISSVLPLRITTTRKNPKTKNYEEKTKIIAKIEEVNLNSNQQLQTIFYENFKESIRYSTEAGNPACDYSALKAMTCSVAKDILNMKACEKTIQFMEQYKRFMIRHDDGQWFIHPTFHQALAVTGRESCSDPNLQQVGGGERDTGLEVRVEARQVFIPRRGYQLRSYDWKNIEVYIPGFKAKDKKIMKILRDGGDVHQNTSEYLTDQIGTEIDRYHSKRTFFGLQYGIGVDKLAKDLSVPKPTAGRIVIEIKREYPELFSFFREIQYEARKCGYVTTAYGRRIPVPRGEEYKAVNYYVQGTAGGILKFAKVKVAKALRRLDAFIVLPIHDELLIEIGSGTSVEEVDRLVVACMQNNPELGMPVAIPVSISKIGSNWAEKEKVALL